MSPLVQIVTHAAPEHPAAWLPWLEDNQGLISIVALVAALAFGLVEQWNANRADARRREDFRKALVAICDNIEGSVPKGTFEQVIRDSIEALDTLLSAAPPAPSLLLMTVRFRRELRQYTDLSRETAASPGFHLTLIEEAQMWRDKLRTA